ncbi:MAG: ATP-binding cassette domain-containing protein [Desulfitobacterium sp.]|nr:ATP-binding cassette domain-containing protein [Desulfitobacterium sp.]
MSIFTSDLEHRGDLKGQGKTILRLLGYIVPHTKTLILAFLLLILATAADVASPILIKIFLDDYLTVGNFDPMGIFLLALGYLFLIIIGPIMQYQQLIRFNMIALRVIQKIRVDIFTKVQVLTMTVFDRTPTGGLVSRVTNDTEAIKDLYVSILSTYVQNFVFLIGIFVAMFALDTKLATFCLVLLPVIILLMQTYRKYSSRVYRIARSQLSNLNAMLNESIQGMSIIQMLRQENTFRKKFANINEKYYQAALANIKLESTLMRPAVDLLYTLALVLVLTFFGVESITGPVEIGVLYAFVNYLDRFIEPVNMILSQLSQLQQAIIGAERVFEVIDDERTVPNSQQILQNKKAPVEDKIQQGAIEFRNVTFSYDGVTDVLKNISFKVLPGQTVALVGHTGSGKSSIANLLMGFYPIKEGQILMDGHPLAEIQETELRKKIGLVAQDPFLFVGNIADNIHLHRPGVTDKDVDEAAKFVGADQFIDKLTKGYEEPIGERGATLSSGQRQLICFARTILGKPKILILDEATASVDTETEEAIQEALYRMRLGRSTIAIAHRLSTIQDADLILVLHQGEIVERGTHQELLLKEGLYYKMFLLQQGAFKDANLVGRNRS